MLILKLLVTFIVLITQICTQQEGYFLPRSIKPSSYVLTLEPISQINYRGSVSIRLEILETASNVTLHSKLLNISRDSVKIHDEEGNVVGCRSTVEDAEREFLIVVLDRPLEKGRRYRMDIDDFLGEFSESRTGFYFEKFKNSDQSESFLALSDFEPMYAREAFPCFDEPHLKAKFQINLIRPSSAISASNSPLAQTLYLGNGRYQDVYKETPPMSTYIVAFVIGNLRYTKRNGRVRLLVRPQFLDDGSTEFVLDESEKVLNAMEDYTGVKYLLDKLDIVGVVNKVGGMENWGLVTFDEQYVICPNGSSSWTIQTCFTYNVHEIAHQWFGNLVTLKSWHYMWLNEGFATYFQYYMADKLKPEWRLGEQYVVEEFQRSLREDCLPLSEPMDFIFEQNFMLPASVISYQKASTIIRMTKHILTEKVFQKSLRLYLNTHQLNVTEPKDLYDCYDEAVRSEGVTQLLGGLKIHEILSSWAKQAGFPVVNVTRNYLSGDVTFTQQPSDFGKSSQVWIIPVTYSFQNDPTFDSTTADFWMTQSNAVVKTGQTEGWILANKQVMGYYRVAYDTENWKRLTSFLLTRNFEIIPPVNRAQLIDDAFFLLMNNKLDVDIFLNLTSYLAREHDYIPIKTYWNNLDSLFEFGQMRRDERTFGIFKGYFLTLFKTAVDSVGLYVREIDTHVDKMKRDEILKIICKLEDFRCRLRGTSMLMNWKNTGKPMKGHDVEIWLCAAMQKSTMQLWNFLAAQHDATEDASLREKYLAALACANSKLLKERFLNLVFDIRSAMKPQERTIGLANFVRHTHKGTLAIVEYVKKKGLDDRHFSLFKDSTEKHLLISSEIARMHTAEHRSILSRLRLSFFRDEVVNEKITAMLIERFPKYF